MKTYKNSLVLLFTCFLISCTHNNKTKIGPTNLVDFLNQEVPSNGIKLNLKENLYDLYQAEKKSWKKQMSSLSYGKKEYKKKNKFLSNLAKQENLNFQTKMENLTKKTIKNLSTNNIQEVLKLSRRYNFFEEGKNITKRQLEIGLCFYKSLLVHYYLLKNNFNPGDIGKVWAVGDLMTPPVLWSYHVATFVRTSEKVIILDPAYSEPLSLSDWMDKLTQYSAENPTPLLRFYMSDPRKFLPNSEEYSAEILSHKNIKNQTQRLLKFLKSE